jgi:hypothetical protein
VREGEGGDIAFRSGWAIQSTLRIINSREGEERETDWVEERQGDQCRQRGKTVQTERRDSADKEDKVVYAENNMCMQRKKVQRRGGTVQTMVMPILAMLYAVRPEYLYT